MLKIYALQLWFGPGVRSIVEGETRFSKIGNFKEAAPGEAIDLKALDLQQLFLAMTEEVHAPSGHADLLRQSASLHDAAPNLLTYSLPLILTWYQTWTAACTWPPPLCLDVRALPGLFSTSLAAATT